jgi:L-fucose isomerase-like protein
VLGSIAVIHPYWDFWASSVPWDIRADREALLSEAVRELGQHANVGRAGLVAQPTDARRFVDGLEGVEAVVVVASMAVPSATGMSVLDLLPDLPVVIWAVSRMGDLPPEFSHSDITTAGSTVGAPMIASALARQGRPFDVVASTLADPRGIGRAVRCATAAGRVRAARLLSIGEPIPGYTTVVPPDSDGHRFHPTLVEVSAGNFARRTKEADSGRVAQTVAEIEQTFMVSAGVDPVGLRRAAAAEVALREVLEEHGCSGGVLNCHAAALRPHAEFGIAPCLALGRLTSEGVPFTCTGDVLTAVAMLAVQSLGLPTLYHEIEALDHERDEAIVANTGEHDRRLCGDGRVDLVPNVWFEHDPITAPCAMFTIPPGPASLVSYVFAPKPRFVVAEGEFTGRRSPNTGTPHAGFRFRSGPVGEGWARWAASGVLHHSAATNAYVADAIRIMAHHLGIEFVSV